MPMAEPSPYMTELLRNPQDWMHQEGRGSVARFRHIEYFLGNKEIIVGVISETFFFFLRFQRQHDFAFIEEGASPESNSESFGHGFNKQG